MREVDRHSVRRTYEKWPELARQGFRAKVSLGRRRFKKAYVLGMGGSAAGGDIIASWLTDRGGVEFSVYKGQLPAKDFDGILAVACSASGNTIETVDMLKTAHERGATAVCISGGGRLQAVAEKLGVPHIPMPEVVAPRYMLPFIVFSCLSVLDGGLGLDCGTEANETFAEMEDEGRAIRVDAPTKDNGSKMLAAQLIDCTPAIYGSRITRGVGVRFKNVLNENAKKHALFDGIPDIFHNEVESWEYESGGFRPFFLRHTHELPRDSKRVDLLLGLLRDSGMRPVQVRGRGTGSLAQLLTLSYRLDMASYYVAVGLGRDPFPTRMIDKMKRSRAT